MRSDFQPRPLDFFSSISQKLRFRNGNPGRLGPSSLNKAWASLLSSLFFKWLKSLACGQLHPFHQKQHVRELSIFSHMRRDCIMLGRSMVFLSLYLEVKYGQRGAYQMASQGQMDSGVFSPVSTRLSWIFFSRIYCPV